uniref:Uncharacterized protein n=1 Tax=Pyramimonas obovata TaxID=1411642 RepID=A0A7S0QX87_9CHLO|mmetsp:Transcript_19152/g.41910  ORF Transcript_19152/g.41910 Transcript_19152/m.41910 type:complete len:326 (+) Transcript_19152:90-1067(+)|eukprot:CAMPEP_0118946258 /NCGR_PEP_ID=MMETSP1169-20130426/43891_1 /TAXON_ID=36882 /ORGANISM="Pyramimonas obovata, Strain CCMP722" /LENGTH=325 /DNA_ID=CAMNT_0006892185 /DNA_START=27 /DNA_END=1004 /DNA_ORIENTATION=+
MVCFTRRGCVILKRTSEKSGAAWKGLNTNTPPFGRTRAVQVQRVWFKSDTWHCTNNRRHSLSTGFDRRASSFAFRTFSGLERLRESVPRAAGAGSADTRSPETKTNWLQLSGLLFLFGSTLGPCLDGIHSRVDLLEYDRGAIAIYSLNTSVWVPILLGVYYTSLGLLHVAADNFLEARDPPPLRVTNASFGRTAACFGTTAILLQVSAALYSVDASPVVIAAVLTIGASIQWRAWDSTISGFGLSVICGLIAPLTEVFIMAYLQWWHYPLPDIVFLQADNAFTPLAVGIPLWVPVCYAFYTPAVGNLAEWLKRDVCTVSGRSNSQ